MAGHEQSGESGRAASVVPAGTAILALHTIAFAALLWWSWRKWPDPLVDFGRELYVPWQLTRGRILYRDIASLFGPLSPYVNASWFRLFGVSLTTLVWANVVIFAATVAGIYHLVRVSTDRTTATAAGLTTIGLCGFSQYVVVGNYNFVAPYSHDATHGFALAVAMLVCVHRAFVTARATWWAAAGLAFGLVLLTKPETGIAAVVAVAVASVAACALGAARPREVVRGIGAFVAAASLPAALFFLYFHAHMPPLDALRAVAGAWTSAFGTSILNNEFYRRGMGLDHPAENVVRMLVAFVGFIVFIATAIVASASRLWRTALLAAVILLASRGPTPRPLPLITFTGLAAAVVLIRRASRERRDVVRLLPLVSWAAFALVLLAKMGLNARIVHYGFYLALPAVVTTVVLMCWSTPQILERWRPESVARGFRQIALLTIAAAIAPYIGLSHAWYATRTLAVGAGGDRFLASTGPGQWEGAAVLEAQAQLERAAAPGATMAVLPEGVMLNYLLRRDSPLRVLTFMPPELIAFGEDAIVQSLETAPPDFVVLVDKDVSEYGVPPFGSDARYGKKTLDWVRARYETMSVVGGNRVEILRRAMPRPGA